MEQRSFSICDRERKRRSPEYKKFIDRAILWIITSVIFWVLIVHIISSIVIYRKIPSATVSTIRTTESNCSNHYRRRNTTAASAGIFSWNLTSPLETELKCLRGRKIPLDLVGSKISDYFLYLCQNSSTVTTGGGRLAHKTPYRKLILLNGSRTLEEAVSFTWSDLEFVREYCLYCIHSVAYCGQMLKLKLYTNRESEDCYYSYVIKNIFVCLNQKQEVTRGAIGSNNIFELSRRELFQFCDIIEYWF
jgi:hypothetical protein